jgi:hypothetical protein
MQEVRKMKEPDTVKNELSVFVRSKKGKLSLGFRT